MHGKSAWNPIPVVAGLIVSLALFGSAFAQGGTVVRVDPAAATIEPGQIVSISINVDSVSNLAGAEIHLAFNPNVLEVIDSDAGQAGVQINNGGMLAADLVVTNQADNTIGTIDFSVAQIGRQPVSGSGTLAIISFRGKAAGPSPITFRGTPAAPSGVILSDASSPAVQIPSTTQNGLVTVTAAAVTPSSTPTPTSSPIGPTFTPTNTPIGPTSTPTPTPIAPTFTPTSAPVGPSLTPMPTPTGPTRTPTPSATPGSGTPGIHIVKQGETLYCIGRAYKVNPWAIASVNRIYPPYWVYPGQVLTIPNSPWANIPAGPTCPAQFQGTPPPVTVTPPPPPPTCRAIHVVQPGETLWSISRIYGTNPWAIGAANNIYNLNLIYPGQRLCIP
jgi:LysM repeat protein